MGLDSQFNKGTEFELDYSTHDPTGAYGIIFSLPRTTKRLLQLVTVSLSS